MSRPTRATLTPLEVKRLLTYEPDTGQLIWKERPQPMFPSGYRAYRSWNARFSSREAFTSKNSHGYKVGTMFGKLYTAHRVIWCVSNGAWPQLQIDHINGDRADNRLINLRETTNSANHKNQKKPSTNTSGTVGVYLEARTGKWVSEIWDRGKKVCIGTFQEKTDAIAARKAAEADLGYHKNHGRDHG